MLLECELRLARGPPVRCGFELSQLPFRINVDNSIAILAVLGARLNDSKFVDLCRQDEITLGQSVNLVRPDSHFRFPPTKADVGMMALLFRQ